MRTVMSGYMSQAEQTRQFDKAERRRRMSNMKTYPKIQSLFNRDEKFKFIDGEYRLPEFRYLAKNQWQYTEKIHGTNIRVEWNTQGVFFHGRTDKSQMIPFLLEKLHQIFPATLLKEKYPDTSMWFYGEGYGARIQKGGGNYISDGVSFACFDIIIDDLWLEWHNIVDICEKLQIETVPVMGSGTLHSAIDWITTTGIQSHYGDFKAEGLVLRPEIPLMTRRGHRIITKIKHGDFLLTF